MAGAILQPADDSDYHPAYRYLIVQSVNTWATVAEQYGAELVLTINTVEYKLFSRKSIGLLFGMNVYEFDLQSILQDLLKWNLPTIGGEKDFIHTSSALLVEGKLYDYYLNSGVVTRDDASETDIDPFIVTNSSLAPSDWHNLGSVYHFTMRKFMSSIMGTSFSFLTTWPDNKKVCWGDSDWLPYLHVDFFGTQINAVRVQTYSNSGIINGTGIYYLQAADLDGLLVKNCFRSISAGPKNLLNMSLNSSWDAATFIPPFILGDGNYSKYTIDVGFWDGTPTGWVTFKTRTYHFDGPCCKNRPALYYLNFYGGIDCCYFDDYSEASNAVVSTGYQKNLNRPYNTNDVGSERISSSSNVSYKLYKYFEENELSIANDILMSVKVWASNGEQYTPFKVKDITQRIDRNNDLGYLIEFEFEFANDYISLRN